MRNLVAEEHLSAADDGAATLDMPVPARSHHDHMRRNLRRRIRIYLHKAVRPLRYRPRMVVTAASALPSTSWRGRSSRRCGRR